MDFAGDSSSERHVVIGTTKVPNHPFLSSSFSSGTGFSSSSGSVVNPQPDAPSPVRASRASGESIDPVTRDVNPHSTPTPIASPDAIGPTNSRYPFTPSLIPEEERERLPITKTRREVFQEQLDRRPNILRRKKKSRAMRENMSSAEMAEEENERPSTMQRGRASSRDQSGSSDRTSEGGRTTELPTATRRFESLDDRMRKADRPSKKVKEKKTGPWYRRL